MFAVHIKITLFYGQIIIANKAGQIIYNSCWLDYYYKALHATSRKTQTYVQQQNVKSIQCIIN